MVDEPEGQACVVCGKSDNFTTDSMRVLLGCDGCSSYQHAGYFPDADRVNDPGRRAPGRLNIRCRLYPPYPKVAAPPCISHTPRALGAVHTAAKCKQKGWNGKRWRMIRLESSKEGKQEGGNAKHRPVGHDSIISTGRRGRRAAATERAPARTEAHAANQAPDRRFEHDGIKGRAGRARGGGGARPRRAAR